MNLLQRMTVRTVLVKRNLGRERERGEKEKKGREREWEDKREARITLDKGKTS